MKTFFRGTPNATYCSAQATAAAPAPTKTTFTCSMRLSTSSRALTSAAPVMIAVPCWSSWKTGIPMLARRRRSITKHSGLFTSSRLMPPKVGSRPFTTAQKPSMSLAFTSRSKTSMSANFLNRTPLPSITGFDAQGPMSPRPRTADPLEMTPTRLPRAVYFYERSRSSAMARQGSATPALSVRIAPEKRIEFEPGQYVTVGLEDQSTGKMIERAYSVCSAPHEEEIEFFFERVPHGQLTPKLYELKPGEDVWMRHRAKGAFTLDRKSGRRNHFVVTTVTGVAPAVSMVRSLRREKPDLHLYVVQGGSPSHELGYREELEQAAAESGGWLTYVPAVDPPWEDPKLKCEH